MTGTIERAVALAERIPPAEIKRSSAELVLVSSQMERGSVMLDNLLGIEKPAEERIKNGLTVLKRQQTQLQSRVTLGTRYHLLSTEPLTWREKDGWPRLVVFSLDSPNFEMKVTGSIARVREGMVRHERQLGASRTSISFEKRRVKEYRFTRGIQPTLPHVIGSCYSDVLAKLGQMALKRKKSIRLSCRFEGLIPLDVKQKITEARDLFKHIFLVAEPNGFTISERAITVPRPRPRPDPDPLVVGFDGSQLWLIADFNTTPVEEMMIFPLPGAIKN
mgnify:CR=1 FL=1